MMTISLRGWGPPPASHPTSLTAKYTSVVLKALSALGALKVTTAISHPLNNLLDGKPIKLVVTTGALLFIFLTIRNRDKSGLLLLEQGSQEHASDLWNAPLKELIQEAEFQCALEIADLSFKRSFTEKALREISEMPIFTVLKSPNYLLFFKYQILCMEDALAGDLTIRKRLNVEARHFKFEELDCLPLEVFICKLISPNEEPFSTMVRKYLYRNIHGILDDIIKGETYKRCHTLIISYNFLPKSLESRFILVKKLIKEYKLHQQPEVYFDVVRKFCVKVCKQDFLQHFRDESIETDQQVVDLIASEEGRALGLSWGDIKGEA